MLNVKKRIIPTLLWKDVGLVKGVAFDSWRRVGSVLPSINVYNTRDVDELILVDITATNEKRDIDYDAIAEYSEECSVPFTVGGGIDNIDKIRKLLSAGADKVAVNSHAYNVPDLVTDAANKFGSQCIVASIDVKKNHDNGYECYSHSGTQPTGKEVVHWALELQELGAGEILLTSIDLDGTMSGYDCNLIKQITKHVDIPVIASGGAGEYSHFFDAISEANASAVAAGKVFFISRK